MLTAAATPAPSVDSARTGWKHAGGIRLATPGSDADAEAAVLRSWADKEEWAEMEQRERVKAAMSDLEQGGAAVLMEGIPERGQTPAER